MDEMEPHSKIRPPDLAIPNWERDIVRFVYKDPRDPMAGEYYVRGGICFPTVVGVGAGLRIVGHAVLICQNIQTKVAYEFESKPFVTVDHVMAERGVVKAEGVCTWFAKAWRRYYVRTFYFNQDEDTARKYRLQVLRSDLFEPKPGFVKLHWRDDRQAFHAILEQGARGVYRFPLGATIAQAIKTAGESELKQQPIVWATMCALNGIEAHPWRELLDDREEDQLIIMV